MYSATQKPLHTLYMYLHEKMSVSQNFDSDLKKLKVLRVENDSNHIVAYLAINHWVKK